MLTSRQWALFTVVIISFVVSAMPARAQEPIRTFLNQAELRFSVAPQIISGRLLIPAREYLEAMGATIAWDGSARRVTVVAGERVVLFTIGEKEAMVNSQPVLLDVPPVIYSERTLVPLRFLAEALGAAVHYDAQKSRVDVAFDLNPNSIAQDASVTELLAAARALLGKPYLWGGTTPEGFDSSGFVQYAFKQVGVSLPRTSFEQATAGSRVTGPLQPGDILVYSTYTAGASHTGIYSGDGQWIHNPNESTGVVISPIDVPYWTSRFLFARRVLGG